MKAIIDNKLEIEISDVIFKIYIYSELSPLSFGVLNPRYIDINIEDVVKPKDPSQRTIKHYLRTKGIEFPEFSFNIRFFSFTCSDKAMIEVAEKLGLITKKDDLIQHFKIMISNLELDVMNVGVESYNIDGNGKCHYNMFAEWYTETCNCLG